MWNDAARAARARGESLPTLVITADRLPPSLYPHPSTRLFSQATTAALSAAAATITAAAAATTAAAAAAAGGGRDDRPRGGGWGSA